MSEDTPPADMQDVQPMASAEGAQAPAVVEDVSAVAPDHAEPTSADHAEPTPSDGAESAGESGSPDTLPEEAPQQAEAPAKADAAAGPGLRKRLEEEGDIAADYLEELLDIADLDGDIDIDVENDRAAVSIIGDGVAQRSLRRLVGAHGEVLEALQELTRLAVQTKTGDRSRLMLDVANFRANRRTELERIAGEVVAKVREGGEPVRLDPMTPFERKVVHDAVAAAGLSSESEGEGASRRVVVSVGS